MAVVLGVVPVGGVDPREGLRRLPERDPRVEQGGELLCGRVAADDLVRELLGVQLPPALRKRPRPSCGEGALAHEPRCALAAPSPTEPHVSPARGRVCPARRPALSRTRTTEVPCHSQHPSEAPSASSGTARTRCRPVPGWAARPGSTSCSPT